MTQEELRVGVVGAYRMGADHVDRLAHHILRARVSAVVDVDPLRAAEVAQTAPAAESFTALQEMLDADAVDAVVLATPGFLHEEALLRLIHAGIPTLCEKPLTPDPESSMRVMEAEAVSGRQLIQVGFMRRFDAGYRQLKAVIDSGEYGELLMLHLQHRNPSTPPGFTNEMIINDSVVHEFDAVRFFTGSEIDSVQVRVGRTTSLAAPGLQDPQQVVIQTSSGLLADVEIFCSAQFGYQVRTQAVFERGVVAVGEAGSWRSPRMVAAALPWTRASSPVFGMPTTSRCRLGSMRCTRAASPGPPHGTAMPRRPAARQAWQARAVTVSSAWSLRHVRSSTGDGHPAA